MIFFFSVNSVNYEINVILICNNFFFFFRRNLLKIKWEKNQPKPYLCCRLRFLRTFTFIDFPDFTYFFFVFFFFFRLLLLLLLSFEYVFLHINTFYVFLRYFTFIFRLLVLSQLSRLKKLSTSAVFFSSQPFSY